MKNKFPKRQIERLKKAQLACMEVERRGYKNMQTANLIRSMINDLLNHIEEVDNSLNKKPYDYFL